MSALPISSAASDPAELEARRDLASLYRLVANLRMTDLIYTHISARIPGPGHRFLINRYGVLFHHMRPDDLVAVDETGTAVLSDGKVQANAGFAGGRGELVVNAAGFTIHSAIHMARPDVQCVLHTHTAAGIAVSAQKNGLLPISQHALRFFGRVAYHDYEGVALDLSERDRLVADLGDKPVMILRNHGLLVAGRTIQEAFSLIYYLERACQAQIAAMAGGAELIVPSDDICERTAAQFNPPDAKRHHDMAWQSALRLLE
ncbi:class II aldolase/adducin family protein [soil metagenome]